MKNKLRIWAKNNRKNIDLDYISAKITENIEKTDFFKRAQNVMIFYPKKYEINVLGLMKNDGKKWFLPRCMGEMLEVCEFQNGDELKMSDFGVLEPKGRCVDFGHEEGDLVIVPALAVCKGKYRLGYGKGYYDRFLRGKQAISVAVCASSAVLESVGREKQDVACDFVVTEEGVF